MRSAQEDREDRKASAVIRDRAMALFASRGTAGVTVRQIAAAADVSPGLVIHHVGSKDGLKEAVDRHAARFVEDMLAEMVEVGGDGWSASLAELFADRLGEEPALAGYVGRLLYEGGEARDALFARLFSATLAGMQGLVEAGVVRRADDERLRDAFLLANDLAVIFLRDQITAATGVDPLERSGLVRWSSEVIDVYSNGVFTKSRKVSEGAHPRRRQGARR